MTDKQFNRLQKITLPLAGILMLVGTILLVIG